MSAPDFEYPSTVVFGGDKVACDPGSNTARAREWRVFIERLDVSRFPISMELVVGWTSTSPSLPCMRVCSKVKHRDTNLPDTLCSEAMLPDFPGRNLALIWIRRLLLDAVVHELDESILFKAEPLPLSSDFRYHVPSFRPFDPHCPTLSRALSPSACDP